MGLEVRRYKNNKYGLYSTISDRMLHRGKLTRKEAVDILKERVRYRYEEEIEKIDKCFPNGYSEARDGRWCLISDAKDGMSENDFYRYKLNPTTQVEKGKQ